MPKREKSEVTYKVSHDLVNILRITTVSGSRVVREDLKFMSPGGNKKFGDRGPGAAKKA